MSKLVLSNYLIRGLLPVLQGPGFAVLVTFLDSNSKKLYSMLLQNLNRLSLQDRSYLSQDHQNFLSANCCTLPFPGKTMDQYDLMSSWEIVQINNKVIVWIVLCKNFINALFGPNDV